MGKNNTENDKSPDSFKSVLEEVLLEGARKMLESAIHAEVEEYLEGNKLRLDGNGHRLAVRNGYHPERTITTGLGHVRVKQPRVDDRNLKGEAEGFSSSILPKYMRRVPSIDNLIPALYLRGLSSNDFPQALAAILGKNSKNLSPNTIMRLKEKWYKEFGEWEKRDLSKKEYVYLWADGIYFNVRLEDESSCILVIIGADREGNKELLAIIDGYRESKDTWRELLLGLKYRNLTAPCLAIADGATGFWSALREVYPTTREQRCWVHKAKNILDKLPKSQQGKAKSHIKNMSTASTKEQAISAYNLFIKAYQEKYYHAVDCLEKDKESLFTFYDFPASHWIHIRTTNPIESTFATVRLRTNRTRGCCSRKTTLTMVYKLSKEAQKRWRKLKGHNIIPLVLEGVTFVDGELKNVA